MMKDKKELKDVFSGVSSLFAVKGGIKDLATIAVDMDIPVIVDTLSYVEGEPTKNSVKVHGLSSDWVTLFEAGETNFSFDVPTKHPDVLELFWGKGKKVTSKVGADTFEGETYTRKTTPIKLGFCILSADEQNIFIVTEVDAIATNIFENGQTMPHLVRVTGSVSTDDFSFLKKKATV